MFLLYYRQYVTEGLAGLLFGLHESNVSRNLSGLFPLDEDVSAHTFQGLPAGPESPYNGGITPVFP